MNIYLFVLASLLIGLATGKLVGAGLAFTGGRAGADLIAGLVGSIIGAVPLHLVGPAGYSEPLPALLIGLSLAMFATWLRRIRTWKKEPIQSLMGDRAEKSVEHRTHDMMTTAEGTRFLLGGGRVWVDERDRTTRPIA